MALQLLTLNVVRPYTVFDRIIHIPIYHELKKCKGIDMLPFAS